MLASRKQAPVDLGRVLVLGLGKSGAAVAAYCTALLGSRVRSVTVALSEDTPANRCAAQEQEAQGAQVALGADAVDAALVPGAFDLCIASPGISEFSPLYRCAAESSVELIGEVEFAWRESTADSVWVAVTGTNGKTTTTALAAHILRSCGFDAAAVGNIGDTCIDAVASGKVSCYVAETSSYQLASTADFAPDVAVLLNITPDHLHWHRTHENYAAAKRKVLNHVRRAAVLDACDPQVRAIVRELKAQGGSRGFAYLPIGCAAGLETSMTQACGAPDAAWLRQGRLHVSWEGAEHDLGLASDLQIKGAHNASNALAAAGVAVALGCSDGDVARALASFAPLEHRIEPCGTVAGVACYNDSKATNVDATLKALQAFPDAHVVVLFGGDDKGTDLADLANVARERGVHAICFGEGGPRFHEALVAADVPVIDAEHLADAVEAGLDAASPGDVLLLSPACASFDEFSCFEERGDAFKALVARQREQRGA